MREEPERRRALTAEGRELGAVPGGELLCVALEGLSVASGGVLPVLLLVDLEGAPGDCDCGALLGCEEPGLGDVGVELGGGRG